jgi:hypothetical protein
VSLAVAGLKAATTYHFRLVATNAYGVVPGVGLTFRTLRDTRAPALIVKAPKRQKIGRLRAPGLALTATCDELCRPTIELKIGKGAARKLRVPVRLTRAKPGSLRANAARTLRVRVPRRYTARLAGTRRVRAMLVVTVADESGNRRRVTRTVALVR